MIDKILIEFSEAALLGSSEELQRYDLDACCNRYAALVAQVVRDAYDCMVEVAYTDNNAIRLCPGSDWPGDDDDDVRHIEDIMTEIWESDAWVVWRLGCAGDNV